MKKAITVFIFVAVLAMLFVGCFSCGAESKSEASAETNLETTAEASVDVGNIETGNVAVGSQEVKNVFEAKYSFAKLVKDIYTDIFTKIIISITILLWATGNLHPNKGFSLFDKKGE